MAEWRRNRPRHFAYEDAKQKARTRALRRLAKLHPVDMRNLYDEELATVADPFVHIPGRGGAA